MQNVIKKNWPVKGVYLPEAHNPIPPMYTLYLFTKGGGGELNHSEG